MSLILQPAKLMACKSCEDEPQIHGHIIFSDGTLSEPINSPKELLQLVNAALAEDKITLPEAEAFREQAKNAEDAARRWTESVPEPILAMFSELLGRDSAQFPEDDASTSGPLIH